jgi:hypothetical protein
LSAVILFEKLKSANIIGAYGETNFELHGLKTKVRDSSVVGNVIQEWLKLFMDQNNIQYRMKKNTQEFADFLMNKTNDTTDLLEVKCFKKSPNFDVANFQAYCRSLLTHAYRLDSDYLIIEYQEINDGIEIKNIWLKKVWEICCGSERSPVKIQWKQNQAVNIRPATWYAKKTKYPLFTTRLEFVSALKKVVDTSSVVGDVQKNWLQNIKEKYHSQTGNDL